MVKRVHPNNPSVSDPEFAAQMYASVKHPRAWLRAGQRLLAGADAIILSEEPNSQRFWQELHRVGKEGGSLDPNEFPTPDFAAAFLLMAYAAENFLKGNAVAKGLVQFDGTNLPTKLKSHDLTNLHKFAGSTISSPPWLLDLLTYCSTWYSRYPVPASAGEYWPMDDQGNLKANSYPADAHHQIRAFCAALEAELSVMAPAQWPVPLAVPP